MYKHCTPIITNEVYLPYARFLFIERGFYQRLSTCEMKQKFRNIFFSQFTQGRI